MQQGPQPIFLGGYDAKPAPAPAPTAASATPELERPQNQNGPARGEAKANPAGAVGANPAEEEASALRGEQQERKRARRARKRKTRKDKARGDKGGAGAREAGEAQPRHSADPKELAAQMIAKINTMPAPADVSPHRAKWEARVASARAAREAKEARASQTRMVRSPPPICEC